MFPLDFEIYSGLIKIGLILRHVILKGKLECYKLSRQFMFSHYTVTATGGIPHHISAQRLRTAVNVS